MFLALTSTSCSTGTDGERVIGRVESPLWFRSASRATIVDHFSKICQSYGFEKGSEKFSECLKDTESQARAAANARSNSSNVALERSLDNLNKPSHCTTTVTGGSNIYTGVTQCY